MAVARVVPGADAAVRHTAHLDLLLAPDAALTDTLLGAVIAWAAGYLGLAAPLRLGLARRYARPRGAGRARLRARGDVAVGPLLRRASARCGGPRLARR